MATWVLFLILCGGVPDGVANCEDSIVEYGLTEDECRTLALKLSAHHARLTFECVRADGDTIEDDNGLLNEA